MVIFLLKNQEDGLNIMNQCIQNQVTMESSPCEKCITRSMCMSKTMMKAMKLCPDYLKYIEIKAKNDTGYYRLLREYNESYRKEMSDE